MGVHLHGRSRAGREAAPPAPGAGVRDAYDAGGCALPAWGYAACSAGSAAAAALATQPLDIVKTRLQVHGGHARLAAHVITPLTRTF